MLSLGEALRDLMADRNVVPEPTLYDLQAVRETHVILGDLEDARVNLERLRAQAPRRTIAIAEGAVRDLERRLIYANRRDVIRMDRPTGCWCLGAGGRSPRYVPMPTAETYTLASTTGDGSHDGEERNVIDNQEVLREYCDCQDGKARKRKDDRVFQMSKSWQEATRIRRMFGEARIPRKYLRFNWRQLPKPRAVDQTSRWLDDPGAHPWALLWGDPGRGKTTIMYGIASEIAIRGEAVLYRTMIDLLADIKATYDPDAPKKTDALVQLLKAAPWLLIDEIGAEIPKDWVGEIVLQVLNHRHNEELPTVLASNYGPERLAEHVGERIMGRIKACAEYIFIGGADLRDIPHGQDDVPEDD